MEDRYKLGLIAILLLIASIGSSYLIYLGGIKASVLIIVAALTLPILYGVIAHPRFGIIVLLVAAYLVMWIMRMGLTTFPLGTLMDGLLALLIIGLFVKQKYKPYFLYGYFTISLKSLIPMLLQKWRGCILFVVLQL